MRFEPPPDCFEKDLPLQVRLTPERISRIAKALAHPERIRILEQFRFRRPHVAGEIVDGSTLAQSTVSEHLRILREAGLLTARKDGPRTWYCFRRPVLEAFVAAVAELAADRAPSIAVGR